MDKVLKMGGEGLMVKDPASLYEHKRSDKLLKIKKFDDAEAVVESHQPGTGWCIGMMGALRVHWKGNKHLKFKIGSGFDKKQRKNPPKIGSVVTFKH